MHEIDKMRKIENSKIQSHHPQINTRYDLGNPIREKSQLESEVALLSFLWYKNDASTKKVALPMELPLTCDLYGCYKISPLLCSQNTTLRCSARLWNKIQCKRMEPLLLLVAQYLTYPNSNLGVGF
jgi:hypothetical protein